MKTNWPLKNLALLFLGVLVFYVITYGWIEHRRNADGPWRVVFTNEPAGTPMLVINEPRLGITNVQITFPGALQPPGFSSQTIIFDQPRPVPYPLPFGECIFMDTTFKPGTVVISFAGHEVQLLPRVMTIDHEERPWHSGTIFKAASPGIQSP